MDEAGFQSCESPLAVSGLAEGAHTFQVKATDAAGNSSATVTHAWIVDTQAPVISIAGVQDSSGVSLTLSANETPVTYTCGLNSPDSACSSTVTYNSLPDGNYVFVAQATDAAGNTSTASSYAFTILTPHTVITQVTPTVDPSNSPTKTIYFSSDVIDPTFVCSLNGGIEQPCTSPTEYSNLVHGAYTFVVKAISGTGTIDPVGAKLTWVVDMEGPVITSFATTATLRSITVTWSTNEPSTRQVSWGTGGQLTNSIAETTAFATTHTVTIPGLNPATTYTIRVNGRDAAGNIYVSPNRTQRTN
jgi:large repetitive protein